MTRAVGTRDTARNLEFTLHIGEYWTEGQIQIALLADVRAELRALNRLLNCTNFLRIPRELGDIRRAVNRIPPRRTRKKK